jgi:hypothetical protein
MMLLVLLVSALFIPAALAAPTTSVHLVKFGPDGTTILNETTVDYQWMEANLPVMGDGVTHYYHQGPVFENDTEARWDAEETTNFKDHGAVKGTAISDLCDLVGGMEPGDDVMIHAVDGYHVEFPYENIYTPEPRQGPPVLCWYMGDPPQAGERQGEGYVPEYYTGMRLIFFADTSTNAEGLHVFGNTDMRECMPAEMLHLFSDLYPSTNGYTVKWIDEVRVYSDGYSGAGGSPVKSLNDDPADSPASGTGLVLVLSGLVIGAALILVRKERNP